MKNPSLPQNIETQTGFFFQSFILTLFTKLKCPNQILNYRKINHAYIYRTKTWQIKILFLSRVALLTYDCCRIIFRL